MARIIVKIATAIGLVVLCLPFVVAAYYLVAFSKVSYPDPVAVKDMLAARHYSGLQFPKSAILVEGYVWEPWLFIAKLQIPKQDLPQFLAQHDFHKLVERDQESNIYEDACATQKQEKEKIAHWKLNGYRHSLLLRSADRDFSLRLRVGWPLRHVRTYVGRVAFLIGLDDPEIATVYLSWDCRGGFAC